MPPVTFSGCFMLHKILFCPEETQWYIFLQFLFVFTLSLDP